MHIVVKGNTTDVSPIVAAIESVAASFVNAITQWKPTVNVNVEPTPVEVNVQPAQVRLEMPKKQDEEIEIVRDGSGKIQGAKIKK